LYPRGGQWQAKLPWILFMLHATGGHAGTICMRLAASRIQFLHALRVAASCLQIRLFFESSLPEQLFE
jgi:hypothetical protein